MSYSPPSGDTVDLIFLEDYIPPEGDAVDLIFGTTIDITYAHIETYLSQDFSLLFDKETYCDQIYGLRLGASLDQPFFDVPVKSTCLIQPYRSAVELQKSLVQKWGDAKQLSGYLNQPYAIPFWLQQSLQQRWAITDAEMLAVLEQGYDLSQYNLISTVLDQPYVIAPAESLQVRPVISVYLGAVLLTSIIHINIEGSCDEDVLSCELGLVDQAEYLACRAQALDASSGEVKDNLVITLDSVLFIFKITPKPSRNRSEPGLHTYTVKGSSPGVLMDKPFARPLLAKMGPGMASAICAELASNNGVNLSWEIDDYYVPAGVLYANDESPMDIVKKLVAAPGAILQSNPDGSLSVRKYYSYPVPQWAAEPPFIHLTDQDNFFTLDENPETRDGFNRFFISSQLFPQAGITYEEKQISDTVREVKVFQTPWDGIERPLQHSGGEWVLREPMGIVEEAVGPEQVEIVAGTGKVTKPIYGVLSKDYKQNQLGAITFGEDGAITTEVAGQSLLDITYITRYWLYKITDILKESVQCYAISGDDGQALGSIVLNFSDAAASNALVVVELDDTLNLDADGKTKTSFIPGDLVDFLVHHDDTVRISGTEQSSGTISAQGLVTRHRSQQMQFTTPDDKQQTQHFPKNISPTWYGRTPDLIVDGRNLTVSAAPAIGEISYDMDAYLYCITPPELELTGEEKFYILTVITLESIV